MLVLACLMIGGQLWADPPHRRGSSGERFHHHEDRGHHHKARKSRRHKHNSNHTDYYGYRAKHRVVHADHPYRYRGHNYHFRNGHFMRKYGRRFEICTPPLGFRIDFRPRYGEYFWYRGKEYMVLDDMVFLADHRRRQLVRVRPPRGFWHFYRHH